MLSLVNRTRPANSVDCTHVLSITNDCEKSFGIQGILIKIFDPLPVKVCREHSMLRSHFLRKAWNLGLRRSVSYSIMQPWKQSLRELRPGRVTDERVRERGTGDGRRKRSVIEMLPFFKYLFCYNWKGQSQNSTIFLRHFTSKITEKSSFFSPESVFWIVQRS